MPDFDFLSKIREPLDPSASDTSDSEVIDFAAGAQAEELRSRIQDRKERKRYARRIFRLICAWLAGMVLLLILAGFGPGGFALDSSVLVTLVGGTTASVVAIFVVVAKYLFPNR